MAVSPRLTVRNDDLRESCVFQRRARQVNDELSSTEHVKIQYARSECSFALYAKIEEERFKRQVASEIAIFEEPRSILSVQRGYTSRSFHTRSMSSNHGRPRGGGNGALAPSPGISFPKN